MDWSVGLDETLGSISVLARGPWDMVKAVEALEAMWTEQARTGVHRVLWDLREVVGGDVSTSQLRKLAQRQLQDRPDLPDARAAVVVARDLEFGMGRMIEAFIASSPVDFQVFRDYSEAAEWLKGEA